MTPDHRPLLGATPVAGLYVNTGYSGHGVMLSVAGARVARMYVNEIFADFGSSLILHASRDPVIGLDGDRCTAARVALAAVPRLAEPVVRRATARSAASRAAPASSAIYIGFS